MFFFFFFQAEDGIRDDLVTGVQTCALPISPAGRHEQARVGLEEALLERDAVRREEPDRLLVHSPLIIPRTPAGRRDTARSEERRVGKECRSRWSADH